MDQKILLIDSGITVQKIVALSLDKSKYSGLYAGNKEEAKKMILEQNPQLILVSDRAQGVEWQRFPKEVEAWLGRNGQVPPIVLLASGEVREAKHYQGILQKPFTPQALEDMVASVLGSQTMPLQGGQDLNQLFEDSEKEDVTISHIKQSLTSRERLESLWEAPPTAETLSQPAASTESISELWGSPMATDEARSKETSSTDNEMPSEILRTEESLAYKSLLENQVQQQLESQNLSEMVEKVLSRLLPPMVERLVQERLDQLLKQQEEESSDSQQYRL